MNNSEEFQKNYFETVVFNELKDKYFPGIKYIRNKYGDLGIDCWSVYTKIINYRIDKYGDSYMTDPKSIPMKTRQEMLDAAKLVEKSRKRGLGR